MKNSKIVKIDSKGRILIPAQIRDFLNVNKGTEIILIPDNKKTQLKIIPFTKEKTAKLKFFLSDSPGSLAKVANILAKYNVNILTSESRTTATKQTAEWNIIADITKCGTYLDKIKERLLESKYIKNMEVVRK